MREKFGERFIGFWIGVGVVLLYMSIQWYFYNPDYGRILTDNNAISCGVIGVFAFIVAYLATQHDKKKILRQGDQK